MKLYCLLRGRSSASVEEGIKEGDKDLLADLEQAGANELSRVAIIDESLRLDDMAAAMEEARAWWGRDPSFVMIDYLELLPGGDADATGVTTKAQNVKRWEHDASAGSYSPVCITCLRKTVNELPSGIIVSPNYSCLNGSGPANLPRHVDHAPHHLGEQCQPLIWRGGVYLVANGSLATGKSGLFKPYRVHFSWLRSKAASLMSPIVSNRAFHDLSAKFVVCLVVFVKFVYFHR